MPGQEPNDGSSYEAATIFLILHDFHRIVRDLCL
nr:MAG TPA_asm: hypothetical protein [Caudoviricetes sp.]